MDRLPFAFLTAVPTALVLFSVVVLAQEEAQPLPSEIRPWVTRLGDPDWAARAEATRWLIRHHSRWCDRVAPGWEPDHPEARWRWRHVRKTVALLQELPEILRRERRDDADWLVRRLREEAGPGLDESLQRCLEASEPRIRQRAVEILARLPGVDLRRGLALVADDPSPWVRRTVYERAAARDPAWARDLLKRALAREETTSLRIEVVRAIRRLASPEWLADLDRIWGESEGELRAETAQALAAVGSTRPEVLHWMLGSGRYPLTIQALSILDRRGGPADVVALIPVLGAPEPELRQRAMHGIRKLGRAEQGLLLVPLLESEDPEMFRFAAQTLVVWGAEDVYGELDHAFGRRPEDRLYHVVSRDGRAAVVPAPASLSSVGITPAIAPRDPR